MRYITIRAKDFKNAINELTQKWGSAAIPISHKKIRQLPFMRLFSSNAVESTAAIDEVEFHKKSQRKKEAGDIIITKEEYLALKEIEKDYKGAQYTIEKLRRFRDIDCKTKCSSGEEIEILKTLQDDIRIEIGYGLIRFVDSELGGTLLDGITNVRMLCSYNLGFALQPVHILDNMDLAPNQYSILIREMERGSGFIQIGEDLAMNPEEVNENIKGTDTIEPVFGHKALWIEKEDMRSAKRKGYTVVEDTQIIATHLTEIIKTHAHEFFSLQDVQNLMDFISEGYPAVTESIAKAEYISTVLILRVMRNLLRERVSIRNTITILETILINAESSRDADVLTEMVRAALARQICRIYANEENILMVISLDEEMEGLIRNAVTDDPVKGKVLNINTLSKERIVKGLCAACTKAGKKMKRVVFLVNPDIRRFVFRLIDGELEDATVISYEEIAGGLKVAVVGTAVFQA